MAKCFVIQPFDNGGPYDKRYRDVLTPAILEAGLEPYRVDQDPGAIVLIDTIETEIRSAEICLADITPDNPNIWYEVGFALANGKPVLLICADPRPNPFPFDIRHRKIIKYTLHSSSDFDKLKADIAQGIKTQAKKAESRQIVAAISEMQTEGLSSHEIAVMVTIMSERAEPDDGLTPYAIKENMKRAGYTPMAVGLALESLSRKAMTEYFIEEDHNANQYRSCRLTMKGVEWLLVNQGRFRIRKDEDPDTEPAGDGLISDEDIPF